LADKKCLQITKNTVIIESNRLHLSDHINFKIYSTTNNRMQRAMACALVREVEEYEPLLDFLSTPDHPSPLKLGSNY